MGKISEITEVICQHRQEIAAAITSGVQFIVIFRTKKGDKFVYRIQFLAGIISHNEEELTTKARKQAENMARREEFYKLYRISEVA